MSETNSFRDFIRRVRAGDEQAATELVRVYEPLIRREVRLQLEDRRLCRVFDLMDVCQSVLASFFVRTAAGQYDLEQPSQLVKLLVSLARNKLVSAVRRQNRQRRDNRRVTGAAEALEGVASTEPSPSQMVAGHELLRRFRECLSDEEQQLAELRGQGLGWAEVAVQLGGTPQARRIQLARAVERVALQFGLDDWGPE